MDAMDLIAQISGWVGTVLFILAYILISTKKVDGVSIQYQAINFFAAVFLGVNTFYNHAWPAFALQSLWAGIAVVTMAREKK